MDSKTCMVQHSQHLTAKIACNSLYRNGRPPRHIPGQRRSFTDACILWHLLYTTVQKVRISLNRPDPPPLNPLPPGEGSKDHTSPRTEARKTCTVQGITGSHPPPQRGRVGVEVDLRRSLDRTGFLVSYRPNIPDVAGSYEGTFPSQVGGGRNHGNPGGRTVVRLYKGMPRHPGSVNGLPKSQDHPGMQGVLQDGGSSFPSAMGQNPYPHPHSLDGLVPVR